VDVSVDSSGDGEDFKGELVGRDDMSDKTAKLEI